jgi:hypothetical protein
VHDESQLSRDSHSSSFEADPLSQLKPPCSQQALFGTACENDRGRFVEKPAQMAVSASGYMSIITPIGIAPMPTQPLPGSIATASTLAFTLVHKYVDGKPLYRLSQAFERAGVPVSRGALGHWVIGSSEKQLHRIYDALKLRLRSQTLIHGDETTVQVLKEKDRQPTSTSYMWAYRSGQESDEPIVLLDYQSGRGQIHPQTFLGDYRGVLTSDGIPPGAR